MPVFRCWIIVCVLLMGGTACQPKAEQGEPQSNEFQPVLLQDFPKVTQTGPQRLRLEAYSLHAQIRYPEGLSPYPHAQIPWIDSQRFSEASGDIITFMRNNDPLRLDKPNIRLSYIRKQAEQPHVEALINWLKDTFVAGQQAQILQEKGIETDAGLTAQALELYLPEHSGGRSQRYLAFAYLDPGQDYMLGFQLSAVHQSDFNTVLDDFYQLVESYEEE